MKKRSIPKKSLAEDINSDDLDSTPLVNAFNNIIKKFSKKSGKSKQPSRVVDDDSQVIEEERSMGFVSFGQIEAQSPKFKSVSINTEQEEQNYNQEQRYEQESELEELQQIRSKKTAKKSSKMDEFKTMRKIVEVKHHKMMEKSQTAKKGGKGELQKNSREQKQPIPQILIPLVPTVYIKQDKSLAQMYRKSNSSQSKASQDNYSKLHEMDIFIPIDFASPVTKKSSKRIEIEQQQPVSTKRSQFDEEQEQDIIEVTDASEMKPEKNSSIQQINDEQFREIQQLGKIDCEIEEMLQQVPQKEPVNNVSPFQQKMMEMSRVVPFDQNNLRSRYSKQKRCNLIELSLLELTNELFFRKLISQKLFISFTQNYSEQNVFTFLARFKEGKLHHFDFQNSPITILDHRRLAQLLYNLCAEIYYKGACRQSDPQLYDFLINLYDLPDKQYFQLYSKIDSISGLKWWAQLMEQHNQKLMERDRDRRIASRKAQEAMRAVSNVVHGPVPQIRECDEEEDERRANNIPGFSRNAIKNAKKKTKIMNEEPEQLSQIRSMVSQFGTSGSKMEGSTAEMRQKIKFY